MSKHSPLINTSLIIGIDAGTSVIKAIAFDEGGKQVAASSIANTYSTSPDGAAVQSMQHTWEHCAQTLQALGEQIPDLAMRTAAIAVTGQGDGTWLIDKDNRPVTEAWLWLDSRAAALVEQLRGSDRDRERFAICGAGMNACQMGAQLAYIKSAYPEMLQAADAALHCKDWLYLNLTGVRATGPCEAVFTFGDFRTRSYDDRVIDVYGLLPEKHLLPDILDGSQATHPLSQTAAEQTGLFAGTPVVLGFLDVACTGLGGGIYTGDAQVGCTIVGSTGMHMRATEQQQVVLHEDLTGYVMPLPIPQMVAQLQTNMASTLNIDWLLGIAAEILNSFGTSISHDTLVAHIDNWLAASTPGQIVFHPYISEAGERGPFLNTAARAGFIGLASQHGFANLVRAVIEGIACAARDCYAAMGSIPQEIRLTGGATRSSQVRQILAAVTGASVRTSSRERGWCHRCSHDGSNRYWDLPQYAGLHQGLGHTLPWHTRTGRCWSHPHLQFHLCGLPSCPYSITARLGHLGETRKSMTTEIAIIGDHFMVPQVFEDKITELCGNQVIMRSRTDAWPDVPMEHGYSVAGMDGLKEYLGTADDVVEFIGKAEILVTHLAPMSRAMLQRLPGLKMIAVSRGGPVNIDVQAAQEQGVLVVNVPGRNSSAVAEFTLGAILVESRNIRQAHEALRQGHWRGDLYRADVTGRELCEMTVGVLGYGAIGTKVVRLLRAFGAHIVVHDPYVDLDPDDAAAGVESVSFADILAQSDVLTMHTRVTPETTKMMDAQAFAAMKPGSIFVNTARGPMVDYQALTHALQHGPLGSAMLETFAVEPVPHDSPLLSLPNVTLTPHIAGSSTRTITVAAEHTAEAVRRYLAGEPPTTPCV